MEILFNQHY